MEVMKTVQRKIGGYELVCEELDYGSESTWIHDWKCWSDSQVPDIKPKGPTPPTDG